ncbi:uncharacterized protein LOC122967544 [Thunnus albacares]|uniref:uncharacterized protein LOC122967544 n=1 Tax=Thunnus albacares TaxID=8236 RepID=UPI001CF6C635|nr:uncharacterized protein LOC122967544 [Thunnus albacares]
MIRWWILTVPSPHFCLYILYSFPRSLLVSRLSPSHLRCERKGRGRNTRDESRQQTENSPAAIYKCLNSSVAVLKIYFDREQDLLNDYRLSRDSLEALIRYLPPERRQAWGHHITVLITVYWLAYGLSYSVVSWAFQVPRVTVCRLVHKGVGKIAALQHEVIVQPAASELEETGQCFQHLANSPVFLKCVGAIDGCHIHVKTPSRPSGRDYINDKLFPSIQLQAV